MAQQAMVSYSADSDSVGVSNWGYYDSSGTQVAGDYTLSWRWYDDYWRPFATEKHIYHHDSLISYEDKFEKAFGIAKMLLKKKLLASRRLNDFIQLVEMIAAEL
jgi:hypothetical protein